MGAMGWVLELSHNIHTSIHDYLPVYCYFSKREGWGSSELSRLEVKKGLNSNVELGAKGSFFSTLTCHQGCIDGTKVCPSPSNPSLA